MQVIAYTHFRTFAEGAQSCAASSRSGLTADRTTCHNGNTMRGDGPESILRRTSPGLMMQRVINVEVRAEGIAGCRVARQIEPGVTPTDHILAEDGSALCTEANNADAQRRLAQKSESRKTETLAREVEKEKAEWRDFHGAPVGGTVVLGIEDNQLWAMMRRFDQQVVHAATPPHKLPPGEPDLRPSPLPSVPFTSDIIKTNLEQVYINLGVSVHRLAGEVERLTCWREEERHRAAVFCAAYFTAWFCHLTVPLLIGFLIVLVLYPPSRRFCFPPVRPPHVAVPSVTDPTNRKGDQSLLDVGSNAVHRTKAEQAEQQAFEFMKITERFGLRVIMGGRHKNEEPDEHGNFGQDKVDAPETEEAEGPDVKEKRDALVGLYAKMLQDALGELADAWERFAKYTVNFVRFALTPPRPYPKNRAREKIAGILFAILLVTAVTPVWIFAHAFSFLVGFAFFGQPIITRGARAFVLRVPDWRERLDIRNSILSGVPTNAQLLLHLHRRAEATSVPLPRPPPPPGAGQEEAEKLHDTSVISEIPHGSDRATEAPTIGEDADDAADEGGKKAGLISKAKGAVMHGVRSAARKGATIGADITVEAPEADKEQQDQKLLRSVGSKPKEDDESPDVYPVKLDGKIVGRLVLSAPTATSLARATFHPKSSRAGDAARTFLVADILEMKKRGVGMGRSVLGYVAGMSLLGTGLEVRVRSAAEGGEETLVFTNVVRREQLFVRLLSMGGQLWESL
ncbi:hypothetical protein PLICRDRAFT_682123 [Plicaturopsis crispa FD-325 SS-3]|nr:hypothetical protein PLICRDRAFT_682123 [Plicaturopsis crispa FD-325 SS-3]